MLELNILALGYIVMDDIECPRCKTKKSNNPMLKLQVNICGHALCTGCIEILFTTGTAKCYQCPTPLKKINFKSQLFQDSQVEKDTRFARDIMNKYSKKESDFATLRDYNDYLEKLETVIYNLANDIDLDETNTLLEELRTDSLKRSEPVRLKLETTSVPYQYKQELASSNGPKLPSIGENYMHAIRSFSRRELAGGFTSQLAIRRCLGDAFNSLFAYNTK